jgi:hypothetical protein
MENVNLWKFSSCDLRKAGSVSVPFPRDRAAKKFGFLADNFKMRLNDFRGHATNISIFENPFSV